MREEDADDDVRDQVSEIIRDCEDITQIEQDVLGKLFTGK